MVSLSEIRILYLNEIIIFDLNGIRIRHRSNICIFDLNDGRGGSAALTTRHPYIYKSWHYISPTSGGHSIGIVRSRSKGHGVVYEISIFELNEITVTAYHVYSLHTSFDTC
jgi:hypothetical protein